MSARYEPYISGCCSTEFVGDTVVDVVEAMMRSNDMKYKLNLTGVAGQILHRLELSEASPFQARFERTLKVKWQAMQTVPQKRSGTVNPVVETTIRIIGRDDDLNSAWVWSEDDSGRLTATRVPQSEGAL